MKLSYFSLKGINILTWCYSRSLALRNSARVFNRDLDYDVEVCVRTLSLKSHVYACACFYTLGLLFLCTHALRFTPPQFAHQTSTHPSFASAACFPSCWTSRIQSVIVHESMCPGMFCSYSGFVFFCVCRPRSAHQIPVHPPLPSVACPPFRETSRIHPISVHSHRSVQFQCVSDRELTNISLTDSSPRFNTSDSSPRFNTTLTNEQFTHGGDERRPVPPYAALPMPVMVVRGGDKGDFHGDVDAKRRNRGAVCCGSA